MPERGVYAASRTKGLLGWENPRVVRRPARSAAFTPLYAASRTKGWLAW